MSFFLHTPTLSRTFLKDVDFIVEKKDKILFVEYKNSNIPNASNPEAFEEKIKKMSTMLK